MPRIFIIDNALTPAHFGVTASIWANQHQLPLWSLRPSFEGDYPDSHQHVCHSGYCVTSGLYRSDTLEAEVTDIEQLKNSPEHCVIVLSSTDKNRISSFSGTRFVSSLQDDKLILADSNNQSLLELRCDHFGRWSTKPYEKQSQALPIAIIARKADQCDAYPAILGALGDAAQMLKTDVAISFIAPSEVSQELSNLKNFAGIILPGGSSMQAVKAQIQVAKTTLSQQLPTLGLCLGMQSMATAIVQTYPEFAKAMLEELDASAPVLSFTAFSDHRHRCGLFPITPIKPLCRLMGSGSMHYNHRYQFNPALTDYLTAQQISISATTGDIVEAISHQTHPFWHGVQGHPELASRTGAPHPLFSAFLNHCQSQI
ncbi:glutamine amidotransferase-related protein [Celerinatantimonas sp. MCCC 1A17872]|uniref:glutamine amidotransferase-related protein n=1 Tax=Celerinatantimonas sp. MCCC 1A17872 TaxID=3177514 RepID=UPI0038C1E515